MNLTVCPPPGNSESWTSILRDLSLDDLTLPTHPEPGVAENGPFSPQWHHTTCGYRGGRLKSNHGQAMAESKKKWSQQ